jgi:hypothetical protein
VYFTKLVGFARLTVRLCGGVAHNSFMEERKWRCIKAKRLFTKL